jgi:EmrB/QacA subfamily drug resistance transporter
LKASRSASSTRTLIVIGFAVFMAQLDNLVVITAIPQISRHLHANLGDLEWTVNAYTLTFAVFLLIGAALGDRFGRRRLFIVGLAIFTAASAAAALSPSIGDLIAARAVQGLGGAILVPLTVTLLSAAVPPERRGAALGIWGAIAGIAIALGPLVGGAIAEWGAWQDIFWLNVPIGVALLPLARVWLAEGYGPRNRLDIVGAALASAALFGLVLALVRGGTEGWSSPLVLASFVAGGMLLVGFVWWELRTPTPMLPLALLRIRAFTMTNVASLLMALGMFGSVFLLTQFLQNVQRYTPLGAGVRELPWTAVPLVVAPVAGAVSDRIGGRSIIAVGLALLGVGLAWLAIVTTPTVGYWQLVPPFVINGVGMSMFFAPVANQVFASVRREQEGIASGTNNALRELGVVLGVAVLTAVFVARGGQGGSGQQFVHGFKDATWVAVGAMIAATAAALAVPRYRPGARDTRSSNAAEQAVAGVR